MNNIQVLGKFLDQPMLVSKFQKVVPLALTAGAVAYTAFDANKEKNPEKRKQRALKTGLTLGVTVASALAAPYVASAITRRPLPSTLSAIKEKNTQLVDSFISSKKVNSNTAKILEKSKEKFLSFKEVKNIFSKVKDKNFLNKLIPAPENISAKDIFSEIGYLSVVGAIPVVGGIVGGIAGDKITDKDNWKKKVPDKVKEGTYQYLANIFLCNVGAGAALGIMEKCGVKSKAARAFGMTAGIIATGVIGGSKIANFVSEKLIEPLFHVKEKNHSDKPEHFHKHDTVVKHKHHKHCERKPEALDIGLHVDDISTVSLLSGLKWIEPALPVMYTISGYRAGIGYRN